MIARSLGAVLAQNYPADRLQIIVADGSSADRTRAVIAALPGAERAWVIPNPKRLQAAGMNAALAHATGDIVVRVDGHAVVAPNYVGACVRALHERRAVVVGGGLHPVGVTTTGMAIAAAGRSRFAVPSAYHVQTTGQFTDTVYMGAWPRETLVQLGGFDEALAINEDYELNWRIRRNGGRVYFDPTIRADYYGRQSYRALARQFFAYGGGKAKMLRRHPRSLRPRQLMAPAFVLALAVAPLALVAWSPLTTLAWLGLLGAYLACNLTFAASLATRSDARLFGRIALAFATMHLAWGGGFWVGALAEAPWRWRGPGARPSVAVADSAMFAVDAE